MINLLTSLYRGVFGTIERLTINWLPGLAARTVFAGVLLMYFLGSAMTKVGDGLFGVLVVQDNAYFQILPSVVEHYGYDASQVPFLPWGLVVYLGTYSEILLPIMLVLGLFTRVAALGMIGFVLVQSYVDIAFHGVDDKTVGKWFDSLSDAAIMDQRALWVFLLLYLVVYGAGRISLDHVLASRGNPR